MLPPRFVLKLWDRCFGPQSLGERGEREAERYLLRKGFIILNARARDRRLGELDLIAVDGRTLVFVEVKTRTSHSKGHPADAVAQEKQVRMTHLALRYLRRHDLLETSARFDIVAVTWPDPAQPPVIEHFVNAFEPPGKGQMFV